LHTSGFVYGAIALILGGIFLQKAWQLLQSPSERNTARSLFKYSIFYLMLLCLAMVIDSLPITHSMVMALGESLPLGLL
jgi:protoheme IX farnesyltransferase